MLVFPELAGARYKECGVRFNRIQRRKRKMCYLEKSRMSTFLPSLTRGEGRMKVKLKVLPDRPRGVAWPSSVRAVRCHVKSCNEQDPCLYLLTGLLMTEHNTGTASERKRREWATVGQYDPNLLGYTRATMVRTIGCNSERRS